LEKSGTDISVTNHGGVLTVLLATLLSQSWFDSPTCSTEDPLNGVTAMASRADFEAQLQVELPRDIRLVLVTDLDGTLLAGEHKQRQQLYDWLEARSEQVLHFFATGRELSSIAALFDDPDHACLRQPHVVISDVGCTVACGTSLAEIPLVVGEIEALWRPCVEKVRALTLGQPGLSPQPVLFQRRHAFYAEPEQMDPDLIDRLTDAGVEVVFSDGRYLDVLPPGVNKGTTLLRVLQLLELEAVPVVVAGDTLNDLAMFQTGHSGVMVGNAESALKEHLPGLPNTYLAKEHGCGGILEGLRHFGYESLPL
jgi:hydroxymethylpyrimidine pyrophosphatase-like HAD family hydrolase